VITESKLVRIIKADGKVTIKHNGPWFVKINIRDEVFASTGETFEEALEWAFAYTSRCFLL
jgi:hypothetical protein